MLQHCSADASGSLSPGGRIQPAIRHHVRPVHDALAYLPELRKLTLSHWMCWPEHLVHLKTHAGVKFSSTGNRGWTFCNYT